MQSLSNINGFEWMISINHHYRLPKNNTNEVFKKYEYYWKIRAQMVRKFSIFKSNWWPLTHSKPYQNITSQYSNSFYSQGITEITWRYHLFKFVSYKQSYWLKCAIRYLKNNPKRENYRHRWPLTTGNCYKTQFVYNVSICGFLGILW